MNSRIRTVILWLVLVVVGLVLWRMISSGTSGRKIQEISYSEFKSLLEQDKVAKVTIRGDEAEGEYKGDKNHAFHLMVQPSNQELYKLLDKSNVNVEYRDSQSGNWFLWVFQLLGGLSQIILAVLVCIFLIAQLQLFRISKTLNQILQELRQRDLKPGVTLQSPHAD